MRHANRGTEPLIDKGLALFGCAAIPANFFFLDMTQVCRDNAPLNKTKKDLKTWVGSQNL